MRLKALDDNQINRALETTVNAEKQTLLSYYDEQAQKEAEQLRFRATTTAVHRRFVGPRMHQMEDAKAQMQVLKHGDFEDIQKHNALIPYIEKLQEEINACQCFLREPYFARMDLHFDGKLEKYYIGKKGNRNLGIMDWRAPVAERYYQKSRLRFEEGGCNYGVVLRRSIKIQSGKWKGYRNEYLNLSAFLSEEERAGRDESLIYDPFLKELLASRKDSAVLSDIIETIQERQYSVICKPEKEHVIVQGTAGSGKTMVLLHRLSYLMYNNRALRPENVLILTPSESFNRFIGDLASTLELEKVDTSTVSAYYLSLLAGKVKDIEKFTSLSQKEDETYLQSVYHGGADTLKNNLFEIFRVVQNEICGEAVANALRMAMESAERIAPHYQALKNAPYQVRLAVLGEIKEKEDGSFLYTRNFRRLMTEAELAVGALQKVIADNVTPYRHALTLKNALYSLLFIKKFSSGEVSGSVRSLRAKEGVILREIEGIRRSAESLVKYSKNKILALLEEQKYKRQIEEREQSLSAIRTALDDVAAISEYFRTLKGLYSVLTQNHLTAKWAGISDPAFAVKFVYNRLIAPQKKESKLFSSSDLYLLVSALTALGYDLKRNHSYLFIDEGQDVSSDEYALLRAVNPTATFDVFGDVAQNVTPYRGITDWAQSGINALPVELNRNYRNTVEIVDFVAKQLGIEMLAVGPSGEKVTRGGDVVSFFRGVKGLKAVIYCGRLPDSLQGRDFHVVAKDGKLIKNKINVMTVLESKGLEFTAVGVVQKGMTSHEKYIAFTRALSKLAVWEEV